MMINEFDLLMSCGWDWQARSSIPNNPNPVPRAAPSNPTPRSSKGKQWCLSKTGADDNTLQRNIDYVCGLGLDCGPIQQHGACFLPNTVRAHAAFAMNLYYQSTGNNDSDCDFDQTGTITNVDPSNLTRNHYFAIINKREH